MPRPRKCRFVTAQPHATVFRPLGRPRGEIVLPVEGLEALRLADLEGLDQEEAAARMGVSRPTFSRVLGAARRVTAQALVEGLVLRIEGGDFTVNPGPVGPGPAPGRGRGGGRGGGRGPDGGGRGGGRGPGPGGRGRGGGY